MLSATLFYQPIRQGQVLIDTMIQIDTRIVSLKKVMDEDTNFTSMLESATAQARELGKAITDVLDSYIEFGRQGFNQEQIEELGRVALIASNVGEISAAEAAASLSSTMIQLGIDAKDTMSIIDSWNILANNNATEVKKLSDGFGRASSTAKQFGLDMHETSAFIGTVTAATKQSGREIGNFLKNALPRLTGQPARDALEMIGVSITDSTGDLRDAMDIYEEVASKFQSLSKMEKAIVAEGLGGKFHISRMTALLTNMDLYNKMLDESKSSAGSALKENSIYMQSLEARINVLKSDFQDLAITLSEAFVNDSFVSFLEVTTDLTKGVTNLVSSLGGIPTILLATAPLVLLMNKNMSNWIMNNEHLSKSNRTLNQRLAKSVIEKRKNATATLNLTKTTEGNIVANERSTLGTRKATVSNSQLTTAQQRLAHSNKVLASTFTPLNSLKSRSLTLTKAKTLGYNMLATSVRTTTIALRGLMSATLVGAGFVAVGYGIEKLIAHFGEARRKAEEFQAQQKELLQTYSQNKNEIDSLVKKYEEYESVIKNTNGQLTERQHEEYNSVKKELAELLPQIVQGESEHGGIILKNTEIVRANLELLERRLQAEKELEAIRQKREAKDNYNQSFSDYENNTSKYQDNQRIFGSYDGTLKALEDARSRLETNDTAINRQNVEILQDRLDGYNELNSAIEMNKLQVEQASRDILNANENVSESAKVLLGDFVHLFATTETDSGKLKSSLDRLFSTLDLEDSNINQLANEYGRLMQLASKGDLNTTQHEKLKTVIEEITAEVFKLTDAENLSGDTKNKLNIFIKDLIESHGDLSKLQEVVTNYFLDEADAIEDSTEATWEKVSATEALLGVTSDQIEKTKQAIKVVALLSQMENLNAQQKEMLQGATAYLESIYPHLTGKIYENIDAIIAEVDVYSELNNASGANADVMMANQDSVTKATIEASNQRIIALQKEAKALQDVVDAYVQSQLDQYGLIAENGFIKHIINNRIPQVNAQLSEAYETRRKAIYDGYTSGGSSSSKSTSSSTNNPANKSTIDALIRQFNLQQDLLSLDSEKLRKQIEIAKAQGDINTQLKLTQDLTKNEQKRISELQQVKNLLHEQANAIRDTNKQYDTSKWFDQDNNETVEFINQFNKASKEQQEHMSDVFTSLQKLKKAYADTNKELVKSQDEIKDLNTTLKDHQEKLADEVVSLYKEAYRKQQEIRQQAINDEMKDLEDAHNRKLKLLDDEYSKYEETINKQLRLLDDMDNKENFERNLSKLQKEELKIRQEISEISLDDSAESVSKRADLEEQLNDKLEQIEDLQSKRTKDLRRQNLQDNLDEKRKEINNEKDAAQTIYDNKRDMLDKEREYWDRHYENLINNERAFSTMRENIISGHFDHILNDLSSFSDMLDNNMQTIGESISQNLIDKLAEASKQLNTLSGKSIGTSNSNGGRVKTGTFSSYGHAQNIVDKLTTDYGATGAKVVEDNGMYRAIGDFGDVETAQRVLNRLKQLGLIKVGYLDKFHEGGLVGGKSSKLGDLINKLFNGKNGETVVRSLAGELQIPPKNFNVGIGRMQDALQSARQSTPHSISIGKLLQIDNIENGSNLDLEQFAEKANDLFIDKLRSYGIIR